MINIHWLPVLPLCWAFTSFWWQSFWKVQSYQVPARYAVTQMRNTIVEEEGSSKVRVRAWIRREILMCPIQGSNLVMVFMTSRRHRQTNSAQALD